MTLFLRFVGITLILFSVHCASPKSEVTPSDLERVMERVAQLRIHDSLSNDEKFSERTDKDRFYEVTRIYRLSTPAAIQTLQSMNPKLADYLQLSSNEP